MSFKISHFTENDIQLVQVTNEATGTFIQVAPAYGAMLHAFTVKHKEGWHNVIDNYSSKEQIEAELAMSYKSSKLSPFVCRINEGKYKYEGELFEFENKFIDGTAIHGLLFNKPFVLVDEFADDEQGSVVFKYNYKEETEGYPFFYRCEIRYTLLPQSVVQLQTTIINLDDLVIPIADGWHPYFSLGGLVDDYDFFFNAEGKLEFDDKLLPTGKTIGYREFAEEKKIGTASFDNCFVLVQDESVPACTIYNEATGLGVELYPDNSYPFLQVYTPPHRKSIAIENLSAAPDAFNNKIGLLLLQPRHTHSFTTHYKVICS